MAENELVCDAYYSAEFKWRLLSKKTVSSGGNKSSREARYYELRFLKKQKKKVLDSYLPCIEERAKAIKEESRALTLNINEGDWWNEQELTVAHPMTFDIPCNEFVNAGDLYRRIGKAWKRSYLLYGQPGTGKSSLIAAMANYLHYDMYDLDLSEVESNTQLKSLLLEMTNRSILVIEHIDCAFSLQNREKKGSVGRQG